MSDEKDKKDDIDEGDDDLDLDLDLDDDADNLDLDDDEGDGKDDDAETADDKDKDADADDDDDSTDFTEEDLKNPEKQKLALEELKKAKSSARQRAIWKKRALKAGWKKDQPPEAQPPKKKTPAPKSADAVEEARRLNERTEFRLDHPEVHRKMIDEIQKYATANNMTLEQAFRRPLIQKFVNDKDLKERLSKASPTSRHRSSHAQPPKDWSRATSEEIAAHEREVRQRASSR